MRYALRFKLYVLGYVIRKRLSKIPLENFTQLVHIQCQKTRSYMRNINTKHILAAIFLWYLTSLCNFWDIYRYPILITFLLYALVGGLWVWRQEKHWRVYTTFTLTNFVIHFLCWLGIGDHLYPMHFPIVPIVAVGAMYVAIQLARQRTWMYAGLGLVWLGLCGLYMYVGLPYLCLCKSQEEKTPVFRTDISLMYRHPQDSSLQRRSLTNKVVFLDFWHTQCRSCIEGFPLMQEIHDAFKGDTNVVVGVVAYQYMDSTAEVLASDYLRPYSFHKFYDDTNTWHTALNVSYVPIQVLLDKQHRSIYMLAGAHHRYEEGPLFVQKVIRDIRNLRAKNP